MNAKGLPSAFDQGVDFGAQSAAAAPDNLLVIFWARAGAVLVSLARYCCQSHRLLIIKELFPRLL